MAQRVFTRPDYRAMPDDWRGELIAGQLVMAAAPVPYHQYLLGELLARIQDHLGPEQRWRVLPSPVDVDFDDRNIFQPDLLILPEDSPRPSLEWEIPYPIWVIEVLSPATARYDEQVKLPRMAKEGVREAWLVAPRAREIEVCDLASGHRRTHVVGETASSVALDGFRLPLAEFFVG